MAEPKRGSRKRSGTRPSASMAMASAVSSVAVLRSGSSTVSPMGTIARATAAANRRRLTCPSLDPSTCAITINRPSSASSDGWNVSDPTISHRRAPFAEMPPTATPARSTTDTV